MVRLMLDSGVGGRPIRTLCITSPEAGEGKTVTAANLAIALAQTGLRTILIDANLRRPMIHELFQQQNVDGLIAALDLDSMANAYSYTVESGEENLRLLLSGSPIITGQLSVARLFTPVHMLALIEQLQAQADILIFDSPPVLEVIETSLLARSCDAALVVVAAGHTEAEELLRTREVLARLRINLLGVILNQAERPTIGLLSAAEQEQALLEAQPWSESRMALPLNNHHAPLAALQLGKSLEKNSLPGLSERQRPIN